MVRYKINSYLYKLNAYIKFMIKIKNMNNDFFNKLLGNYITGYLH